MPERDRAHHQARERRHLQNGPHAAGQPFTEQNEPGRDRHGIGHHRRAARRRQRITPLIRPLQHAGPGRVGYDQRADGSQPQAAVTHQLGGDVAVGEQQPGRQPQRCGPGEPRRVADQQHRPTAARGQPDDDTHRGRALIGLRAVHERQRQQHQPGDRQDDGGLLPPGEPGRMPARGGEGQDGNPRRRHGLHQRQRRQPQRRHVHQPARTFDPERHQPPTVAEQQPYRLEGPARGQRRQRRRRIVLQRVGHVRDQR